MTKKIKRSIIKVLVLLSFFWFFYNFSWVAFASSWNQEPLWVLEWLKDSSVQKTALDENSWKWVKWVLEWVKDKSGGYIQWLWFIWLATALILIIRLWIYILWNFWEEDRLSKAKKRFVSLILWVIILTSWYVIIKAIMSIVWNIAW